MLDTEKYLISAAGDRVQGRKGPIQVNGEDFTIADDGTVLVDGVDIDSMMIVEFDQETRLNKMGNSYWAPGSAKQKPKIIDQVDLRQGVLEGSNVDTVQEMVKMINVNRSYESAQRLMRSLDEVDEQSISIARI
jgi:flagellar basal-body rod protein FlgG